MSKKIIFYTALLAIVMTAAGCSNDGSQNEITAEAKNDTIAAEESSNTPAVKPSVQGGSLLVKKGYELAVLSGTTLSGEEFGPELLKKASVTMLNVWTTTCPYCIEEMPMLEELSHEILADGVQIVGIIGDGKYNPKDAQKIIEHTGVTYLNLIPTGVSERVILNIAYAVPTTLFVDSDGRILGEPILGMRDKEYYRKQAESALKQL